METPYRLTAEQLEQRRLAASAWLREGSLSQAEIARRLGVTPRAVSGWSRRLRGSGPGLQALLSRRRTGRPPRLDAGRWRELIEELRADPRPRTAAGVADLIRERYGVSYHPRYVARRLREVGLDPGAPDPGESIPGPSPSELERMSRDIRTQEERWARSCREEEAIATSLMRRALAEGAAPGAISGPEAAGGPRKRLL